MEIIQNFSKARTLYKVSFILFMYFIMKLLRNKKLYLIIFSYLKRKKILYNFFLKFIYYNLNSILILLLDL